MPLRGACRCSNVQVRWQTVDYSVVPRACQCDYCTARDAAYVSKAGTVFSASIARPAQYRVVSQGSGTARFHECAHCQSVVFVTAELNGTCYGALNAVCLANPQGFSEPLHVDFSGQSVEQKVQRWHQHWCLVSRIAGLQA